MEVEWVLIVCEEDKRLGETISLKEIEEIFKGFAKSMCLGSNGWIVEFFLEFFDILGNELWKVVEELRI